MMLIAAQGGRRRLEIVVAGGLLPVGYQIFRMGYYGLLFPGTALAKDAGGDKWSQGLIYLSNFNGPYVLWVPLLLLAALGLVLVAVRARRRHRTERSRRRRAARRWPERCRARPQWWCSSWSAGCCRRCTGSARAATSCTAGCCWCRCCVCWRRSRWFRWWFPRGPDCPARPGTGWPAGSARCGCRWRDGRCGRPIRPAWAMTPPASPTPASSTSAGSTRRQRVTRIR